MIISKETKKEILDTKWGMNMTRGRALVAMSQGHKVTHINFASSEYLSQQGGDVMTEDGYYFNDRFFKDEMFEDGWSIFHA